MHIATRYFQQLLRALRFLKKLGFVHTDLKPDNIFWNLGGRFGSYKGDAQIRDPPPSAAARLGGKGGAVASKGAGVPGGKGPPGAGGAGAVGAPSSKRFSDAKWDELYAERVKHRHEFVELDIEHVDTVYWNAVVQIGDLGELLDEQQCKVLGAFLLV